MDDEFGGVGVAYRTADLHSQMRYAVLDLNLIWEAPVGALAARLCASNATDQGYVTAIFADGLSGSRYTPFSPPRQIGVELRANLWTHVVVHYWEVVSA